MAMLVLVLNLAFVLLQSAGNVHASPEKEIVDKHNALRRAVNPAARNMLRMEWNRIAAENAKRWASRCTLSHSPSNERTVNGVGCGENLFMSSQRTSWSTAIQAWFDERKNFKYGIGAVPANAMTGHYTQVVWYRSYLIGCGQAYCPSKLLKHYYVCQYCPAGNIVGLIKTPYKSGPPCEDCPNACDHGLCTNPCKHVDRFSNCEDLAKTPGCEHPMIKKFCPASCLCTTEIK